MSVNVIKQSVQGGNLSLKPAGKIESEGLGEVQEMIDICDYAVGFPASLRPEDRH
jgi:hypothetical protein